MLAKLPALPMPLLPLLPLLCTEMRLSPWRRLANDGDIDHDAGASLLCSSSHYTTHWRYLSPSYLFTYFSNANQHIKEKYTVCIGLPITEAVA